MKNKNLYPRIAESVIAAAAATLFVLTANSAGAATINVDTAVQCDLSPCDTDDAKPGCSFGEAITAINGGTDVGDCKNASADPYGTNDTIHLPASTTFEFSDSEHSYPVGPTALPTITRSVTIHGHGSTLKRAFVDIKRNEDLQGVQRPMRYFEIASLMDRYIDGDYNVAFDGSEVLVFWDQTTFDGGNPGCTLRDIVTKDVYIEQVAYLDNVDAVKATITDVFDKHDSFPSDYSERTCHSGGAGYVRGSGTFVSFDEATFKDNQVDLHWPYYSPLGGAVFIDGGAYSMANFNKSLFTGNKAPAGGAIYAGTGVQMAISDSTFADNAAVVLDGNDEPWMKPTADGKMGGAVFAEGTSLTVNGSSFFRNEGGVAGALAVRGETTSILNTTFFDNVAEFSGGAVALIPVPYSYRDLYGPQIPNSYNSNGFSQFAADSFSRFGSSPSANLQHVTMVGNSAGAGPETMPAVSTGGGIANLGAGVATLKSLILTSNAVGTGGSGPNCYGGFVSYGTNDLNWPTSDGSCVAILAPGAHADLTVDPILKACNPDITTGGLASCDPDTTSPLLEAALNCPSEDQHHAGREPEQCTVGAIEVKKPTTTTSEGTVCGNGQLEAGEECDEGEGRNSDSPNATCRKNCTQQSCGDGILDSQLGEECEPSLDPINCRSDCTIDICTAVKGDAMRVGTGEMTLQEYLDKYDISPSTGCSPNPDVNRCQPLASLGGPGSDHADFTVPNTVCQTTPGDGGCSLSPQAGDGTKAGTLAFLALPGILLLLRVYRSGKQAYLAMRS